MKFVIALIAAVFLTSSTIGAEINLANVPVATTAYSTNRMLGVDKDLKSRLFSVSQLMTAGGVLTNGQSGLGFYALTASNTVTGDALTLSGSGAIAALRVLQGDAFFAGDVTVAGVLDLRHVERDYVERHQLQCVLCDERMDTGQHSGAWRD